MQSVSTTVNTMSSKPVHGEVYSIQHYEIKFVSDSRQVGGFSPGTPVSSVNETGRHDITEIFLELALNTITLTKLSNISHKLVDTLYDLHARISNVFENKKSESLVGATVTHTIGSKINNDS